MSDKIVEVFGQFAVDLGEGPKLFTTFEEANAALIEFENGAEHRALAEEYCAYKGLEGKNAKGKVNVITDFLAWVDAGRPEAVVAEEAEEAEAETDEEAVVF